MAATDTPAFVYGIPSAQTPTRSAEVRANFEALARTSFTEDPNFPPSPKEGQQRIRRDPLTGIYYLEAFITGSWVIMLQNIQFGFAAPTKQIVDVPAALTTWQIDHNLNSFPIVQVFNSANQMLTPVPLSAFKTSVLALGSVPLNAIAAGVVRAAVPLPENGNLLRTWATCAQPLTTPANLTFSFVKNPPTGPADPMTPQGNILINANLARGATVLGSAITTEAPFAAGATPVAGTTLDANVAVVTPPSDGVVELYALLERTLGPGECRIQHINNNRFTVTFATAQTGYVVLMG